MGDTAFGITPAGWTVSVCRIAKHLACPALTAAPHSRAVLWCRIGAAAGTAAEAETAGGTRFVRAIKPLEKTGQMFLLNSGSLVGHPDFHLVAGHVAAYLDARFVCAEFNRIIKQVAHGLLQQDGIDGSRQLRGTLHGQDD